ncbi:hypothetical protein [Sphingobium xenophagum]
MPDELAEKHAPLLEKPASTWFAARNIFLFQGNGGHHYPSVYDRGRASQISVRLASRFAFT